MKASQVVTVTVQIEDASGKSAVEKWSDAKKEFVDAMNALRLRMRSVRKRIADSCGQDVPTRSILLGTVPSFGMYRIYLGRVVVDDSESGVMPSLIDSGFDADPRESWKIGLTKVRELTAAMVVSTEEVMLANAEHYLLGK